MLVSACIYFLFVCLLCACAYLSVYLCVCLSLFVSFRVLFACYARASNTCRTDGIFSVLVPLCCVRLTSKNCRLLSQLLPIEFLKAAVTSDILEKEGVLFQAMLRYALSSLIPAIN